MKTNNKLVIDFLAKKNFRKFALYPSIFFTFDSFSKHSLISWRPMIDELDVQMSKISFRHPCHVVRLFSRIDCLLTLLSSKIAIKIIFKRRKHEVYKDGEKWVFFRQTVCGWQKWHHIISAIWLKTRRNRWCFSNHMTPLSALSQFIHQYDNILVVINISANLIDENHFEICKYTK